MHSAETGSLCRLTAALVSAIGPDDYPWLPHGRSEGTALAPQGRERCQGVVLQPRIDIRPTLAQPSTFYI